MSNQSKHIQPHFLAAHGAANASRPSLEDLGLLEAAQVADRYSDIRSKMDFSVTSPDIRIPVAEDPWREVAGLFGSIGESLAITIPCEVEIELHRRARSIGDLPDAMLVAERFFAESEAQKVIEIAHRSINLAFRAVGLRYDWKQLVAARKKYAPLVEQAFSAERTAWITFSAGATHALTEVCDAVGHQSAADLAMSLRDFALSGPWEAVEEQRGEDFHRWRLESSVMAGVDASSSLIRDVFDANGTVIGKSHGTGARSYAAGSKIEERVSDIAAASLRRLVPALNDLADAFLALVEPASHGRHSWSQDTAGFVHHVRSWKDSDCGCCA